MNKKMFKTAMYIRLSKDDSNLNGVDSISNQKAIIENFINNKDDMNLILTLVDNGYSGGTFERPAFKNLIKEVKEGRIDCIVVKDFSRLGRNFIEVSKYIESIFPFLGVRFISINDNYDSIGYNEYVDGIMVPIKNLLNDAYLMDISIKIKTQLEAKMKNGEFVGSFAVYGYMKDLNNKNKLVIDEISAKIVREIFRLKLKGISCNGIANILNEKGILSPMEYKKYLGLKYNTNFKKESVSKWSSTAVLRILKNKIYIGNLEQGKTLKLNYKSKEKINKDKSDWIIIEDSHEPIIDKIIFNKIQIMLENNNKINYNDKEGHLFSGIVYCDNCRKYMCIKKSYSNNKKYIYYTSKKNSIREDTLKNVVFEFIIKYLDNIFNFNHVLGRLSNSFNILSDEKIYIKEIDKRKEYINNLKKNKFKIYEDYKTGLLDKYDYLEFNNRYNFKIDEYEKQLCDFEQGFYKYSTNKKSIENKNFKDINLLDRWLIINIIEKIVIYSSKEIGIKLMFSNSN